MKVHIILYKSNKTHICKLVYYVKVQNYKNKNIKINYSQSYPQYPQQNTERNM